MLYNFKYKYIARVYSSIKYTHKTNTMFSLVNTHSAYIFSIHIFYGIGL